MIKNIKSEMNYNSFALTFNDKAREKEYTYFRYLHKASIIKNFLLIFSVVYFAIIALDFYLLNAESYILFFMKISISVIGLILYFLYDKISFVKQTRYIVMFNSLVYISIIIQALFYPGTKNTNLYIIGYSMIVYSTYFLIGIRIKDSFVLNIIAQIIFYTLLIYKYPLQVNLIYYFLLFQVNILFLFSAYFVERTGRQLFFYINKLELENEKQVRLYRILEANNKNNKKHEEHEEHEKHEEHEEYENYEKPIIEIESEDKQNVSRKNNILIVDDEKDNVLYFEQVSLKLRLNLFKARNGLDAVNMYKKYKSDIALVLMDIRMPEMNGYEATKEIKKINKDIPVILITAYSEELIPETEADLILSKPITPKALTDAIKQYI